MKTKYRSLVKERPWAENLTSLPKRRVDTISNLTAKEQKVKFKATNLTNNNLQQSHIEVNSNGTQHSEWHDVIMSMMSP